MPKSDTQDIVVKETTGEMDSEESCQSTSDDGLQFLSAEEKACLMFLEETIESLDTEEESSPSHDRAESYPAPGNTATKMAHLSASMDQMKHKDVPKHCADDRILNYLVPSPVDRANSRTNPPKLAPKTDTVHKSEQPTRQGGIHVPSEVNVLVTPQPFTAKNRSERDQEPREGLCSGTPRGPLSNACMMQLHKNVSESKKTESKKKGSDGSEAPETHVSIQLRESQNNKSRPPAVAPKPRNLPSHIAIFSHKGTSSLNTDSSVHSLSTSPGSRGLINPDKVRLEALCKLGLLKEKESEIKPTIKEECQAKTQTPRNLQPPWSSHPDLSQSRPFSFCASAGNQELAGQGSNVLHQHSTSDLTMAPSQRHHTKPAEGKTSTLERSGRGLGSSMSGYAFSDRQRGCRAGVTHTSPDGAQVSGQLSSTPPVPHKQSHPSGLSALMVPSMGDSRQEALRKLGLLKS